MVQSDSSVVHGNRSESALFIGRFQPLHKGHVAAIEEILTQHEQVIVGLGSAQESFSQRNPFTAKEREDMIALALGKDRMKRVRVVAIVDINDDSKWVQHVSQTVGAFSVAYTNNDLVFRLFSEAGISVVRHHLYQPDIYQGVHVREVMVQHEPWEELVVPEVATYLDKIRALDRLYTLAGLRDIRQLMERFAIPARSGALWEQAFTHKSYCFEHELSLGASNERLEFLGDAVLELAITQYLFRRYDDALEGVMTSQRSLLVRTEHLAKVARTLDFGFYIRMSFGEEKNGGRDNDSILANVVEAFLGALFLEKGMGEVESFLHEHLLQDMPLLLEDDAVKDFKTKLQELLQEREKMLPEYVMVAEEGMEHDKVFTYAVVHKGNVIAEGEGKNKQQAQQLAAERAYGFFMKQEEGE